MAKLFRITWGFDEPKQGWSESWYFQREGGQLRDLLDEFEQLGNLRAALLGAGGILSHVRISQVMDTVTGVRTPRLSLPRDLLKKATTTNTLCAPHDSLLVQCITSDQAHKKVVYLGGVWNKIFDELRHYKSIDAFQTRLDDWALEVKARGLGWLSQSKDVFAEIQSYTSDPLTFKTTYVLDAPITFDGDPKRRRCVVDFPGGHKALDGVQLVAPVAGQPLHAITVKPRPTTPFDGVTGSLKTYKLDFVALGPVGAGQAASSIDAQRMARRNRGKALYAEAGRRPAQARI